MTKALRLQKYDKVDTKSKVTKFMVITTVNTTIKQYSAVNYFGWLGGFEEILFVSRSTTNY